MPRFRVIIGIFVSLLLLGCQPGSGVAGWGGQGNTLPTKTAQSTANGPEKEIVANQRRPLALLDGRVVRIGDLQPSLLESQGGEILAEWVLDRAVGKRLAQQGGEVTQDMVDKEAKILADSLSADDPNAAARLLAQLKTQRGLGTVRFTGLLRRNAGLRLLVQASVKVGDDQLRHAFFLRYGGRYETRLIVVKTLREATSVVGAVKKGESFIDLAIERSTDISRSQGGLLPPISPADQNYPQAVRAAVVKLKPGQISDPIALENGFAVLRLERKKEARNVQFDDVKEELRPLVRRRTERVHMQQLARELLTASDLVVLDRGLRGSWDQYRKTMEGK